MDPILHRDALDLGMTARDLRSAELVHPADGTSMERSDAHELRNVCATIALILGHDGVFTHLTSAALRQWWLPRIDPAPIIACTHGEAPHLDRRGVYVRRCDAPSEHREVLHGIPIASAEWTIVELAEHVSLIDLVVVIDCALHRGEASLESIRRPCARVVVACVCFVGLSGSPTGEASLPGRRCCVFSTCSPASR